MTTPENLEIALRSLVTSREAGILIGKGGQSVSNIREETDVKIGVNKMLPGVNERIVTVNGSLENVAKAYALINKLLVENSREGSIVTRLLIAHQLAGSIIGKGGIKIKQAQEISDAKIVISKDMLPQSTERVVEIVGSSDAVKTAIIEIGKNMSEDLESAQGVILYDTQHAKRANSSNLAFSYTSSLHHPSKSDSKKRKPVPKSERSEEDPDAKSETISVAAELVGSIIGPGGAVINDIRATTGAKIHIAALEKNKTTRNVIISGSPSVIESALNLINQHLDAERKKNEGKEDKTEVKSE
ncbi:RNA binding protein, heterogenous nuclear RNP-K like protein [Boothiomyces sp. JEL0866]|nr:RNA binding protein, heterogenous nuclear RNP-K like protein [Boothiomyces sp. JEL0866]KAJ3325654.1 RNA binding protein, heterogenous nuclear RNP-K like protein [Boothiomyces sp. JEL0866]